MPAFADEFPSDGYMLEDMVYEEAATHSNMGVYDGTVTATAEYEDILYEIMSGTYLPAGSEGELETCPENSYCPGDVDVTYNETTDQGISSCPSGYPNSAAGASSDTQCYTACTVNSANIEHAMAVDGNDYYNTDADTCAATACDNGYHVEDQYRLVERTPVIDVDLSQNGGGKYAYINLDGTAGAGTGSASLEDAGLSEKNTWAALIHEGVVYGRAGCNSTISAGEQWNNDNWGMIVENWYVTENDLASLIEATGEPGKAKLMISTMADDFEANGGGTLAGLVRMLLYGTYYDVDFSNTTNTGNNCYCQVTGFVPTGGEWVEVTNAPWLLEMSGVYYCARDCAKMCAGVMAEILPQARYSRAAFLRGVEAQEFGVCEGNEITINWTDATDEDIAANNAGMCTYGGDIRTPVAAMEKPGKTFVGWKFSK